MSTEPIFKWKKSNGIFWEQIQISLKTNPCLRVIKLVIPIQSVLAWSLKRKVVSSEGSEKTWRMQPGDLVPTFRGRACLAGPPLRLHHSQRALHCAGLLWGPEGHLPPHLILLCAGRLLARVRHLPQGPRHLPWRTLQPCRGLHWLCRGAQVLQGFEHFLEIISFPRVFAATSLNGFNIPLVEDKTGEICRNFGVVDQDPSGHGDQVNTAGAGPDQPHGGAHHLHLGQGGRAHGLLLHQHQGDLSRLPVLLFQLLLSRCAALPRRCWGWWPPARSATPHDSALPLQQQARLLLSPLVQEARIVPQARGALLLLEELGNSLTFFSVPKNDDD